MTDPSAKIVIAGTGSIGCYVGGCLALAGRPVTFLARPRVAETLRRDGLLVTDLEGNKRTIDGGQIAATDNPAEALRDAALVLVCVKSGATAEMAGLTDRHAPEGAPVISLQNGVNNAERIREALTSDYPVIPGMVAFNVVLSDGPPLHVHRATDGKVLIDNSIPVLADRLNVEGLPVATDRDMKGVLWGKLLLNLNNALNALSGLPLAEQLSDRAWRRLLAGQMDEALAAMQAAGVAPARLAGVSPTMLPTILRLPNWLFSRLARRMLAIDPQARSSMWEDLERRRLTEIDQLQGTVQRLGVANRVATPLNAQIVELIRRAEAAGAGSPRLSPDKIRHS